MQIEKQKRDQMKVKGAEEGRAGREERKKLTGQRGDSGSLPLRYCHGDELEEGEDEKKENEVRIINIMHKSY